MGDAVLVRDESSLQCQWPVARVKEVFPSDDGMVRKVKLLMGDRNLDVNGKRKHPPSVLCRPVQQLVLLFSTLEHPDTEGASHSQET